MKICRSRQSRQVPHVDDVVGQMDDAAVQQVPDSRAQSRKSASLSSQAGQ